ncbi:hypothetical protein C1H76_6854 [Elsinoe australis]|uniref:Alb1-domain-containing protein n=1 Tax=Elsinoe australis TaxID=40998 RepID=A0A4U7ARV6_9PEZI|nr:hypothetical protein C1H76_6854 [Elsinoe australis]
MAKVAKSKKTREVSSHSRAARRAASPSLDVDKSILDIKAPEKDTNVSYGGAYAGISKKKKSKPLTRQQRLRQEKGMERASNNLDKLSKKVADSQFREKKVKNRNAAWEELNEKVATKTGATGLRNKGEVDVEERDSDVDVNNDTASRRAADHDIAQAPMASATIPTDDTAEDEVEVDEVL